MKSSTFALVALVTVGLCAPTVVGLWCYECDRGGCVQPWYTLKPQDCSQQPTTSRQACITMRESGVVTSMGCTSEDDADVLKKTTCRDSDHSCSVCYTDLCNAATRSTPSSVVGSLAVGLAASLAARLLVSVA